MAVTPNPMRIERRPPRTPLAHPGAPQAHPRWLALPPRPRKARAGPHPQSPRTPALSPSHGPQAHAPPRSAPTASPANPAPRPQARQPSNQGQPCPSRSPQYPSDGPTDSRTAPASTAADSPCHRSSAPLLRHCYLWRLPHAVAPRSFGSRTCSQGSASARTDPQPGFRPSEPTGPQPRPTLHSHRPTHCSTLDNPFAVC